MCIVASHTWWLSIKFHSQWRKIRCKQIKTKMNDHICLCALWHLIHRTWASSLIPCKERCKQNKDKSEWSYSSVCIVASHTLQLSIKFNSQWRKIRCKQIKTRMSDHIYLCALWHLIHGNWASSFIPSEERCKWNKDKNEWSYLSMYIVASYTWRLSIKFYSQWRKM